MGIWANLCRDNNSPSRGPPPSLLQAIHICCMVSIVTSLHLVIVTFIAIIVVLICISSIRMRWQILTVMQTWAWSLSDKDDQLWASFLPVPTSPPLHHHHDHDHHDHHHHDHHHHHQNHEHDESYHNGQDGVTLMLLSCRPGNIDAHLSNKDIIMMVDDDDKDLHSTP